MNKQRKEEKREKREKRETNKSKILTREKRGRASERKKNLYALTGNRTRVSCLVGTHSATKPLVLTYNRYINPI